MNKWLPCLLIGLSLALPGCDKAPSTSGGSQTSRVPLSALYDTVAAKAAGFSTGNMMATRVVYVMFDPQCPHCARLWQTSKPLLAQVRMVWSPVRFAGDISLRQGAVLLAAKDPVAEMDAHERSLEAKRGGLVPPPEIAPELLAKVKANTDLMAEIGADEVPFVVYKDPRTGQPASFRGAMETEELRKLLGI
ncbi:MAG: thioredoxin fold domain-containing protein [Betaproteobacteria bacterium]|nr:thioredoxin fold domain-containing protein [Betaproteobacteria bacterium]